MYSATRRDTSIAPEPISRHTAARDDRLGRREDHVARVGRGVAERHRRSDASLTRECELARREQAGIDLGPGPGDERGPGPFVDPELGQDRSTGVASKVVTRRSVQADGEYPPDSPQGRRRAPTEGLMGLDKTPDLASIEERARQRWEETGIYRFDPEAPGEIFSIDTPPPYVSAAAPARRPRDVVRAGGVHRPLHADARAATSSTRWASTTTACRRSATSSRSTRSTRPARRARSSARSASRRPPRSRSPTSGSGASSGSRSTGACATRRSTTTAAAPRRSRSSTCSRRAASTAPRNRCSGIRRCRRRSRRPTSRRSRATRRCTTSRSARLTAATS